jgi:hypothetical protein
VPREAEVSAFGCSRACAATVHAAAQLPHFGER